MALPAVDVVLTSVIVAMMPRLMSVWPVAIQTRLPDGIGIIGASEPAAPAPERSHRRWCQRLPNDLCRRQSQFTHFPFHPPPYGPSLHTLPPSRCPIPRSQLPP